MSTQAFVELLHNIMSGHHDPVQALAEHEQRKGHLVIRPGDVSWLPAADWEPATLCGRRRGDAEVRLVLLHAVKPGAGAFTRVLAGLALHGLRPTVIDPTPEFAAALARRGWNYRAVGRTFETRETIWRPAK